MQRDLSENDERGKSSRGPRRLVYGFACSGALHGALFLIASFGSCLTPVVPTTLAASASLVSIDVLPPVPARPAPAIARSALPGGGAPVRHSVHLRPSAEPAAAPPPPVVPDPPTAAAESPAEPPLLAEATSDDGIEVPATSDSEGSMAPPARAPDAGVVSAVSSATVAAAGTGRGANGGPGGYGRGPGGGRLPAVTQKFALGSDVGDFKAVVCFIQPGTLRIADVHRCDPAAVFYTDTFNIPERQYTEGFPGITGRSSWFMVDYRGSFTVRQDGDFRFRLYSDDGAYLYIDGALVIENDGKHEPISRWGNVHLQRGRHQLKLLYAQTIDRMALQLFVRLPGAWTEKLFTSDL
jgi:PA14 domain